MTEKMDRIVQWLRSRDPHHPVLCNELDYYGDAIARGEHWEDRE